MNDDESCTATANPTTHSRHVLVDVRPATDTANDAESPLGMISVHLSSKRRLAFTYDTNAYRKRRTNLIANRGIPRTSTSDQN